MSPPEPEHEFDDDGCCVHCNFDGAEWHWWKHSTYEGRAQPEARQPLCHRKSDWTIAIDNSKAI